MISLMSITVKREAPWPEDLDVFILVEVRQVLLLLRRIVKQARNLSLGAGVSSFDFYHVYYRALELY